MAMTKTNFSTALLLPLLWLSSKVALIEAQTNIALNKPATQLSTDPAWGGVASKAVDGNADGRCGQGSVTATDWANGGNVWWQVELSGPSESCSVDQVTAQNGGDGHADRLIDSAVQLWDGDPQSGGTMLAQSAPLTSAASQTVSFTTAGVRCVRLFQAVSQKMNIAEVEVFGTCGAVSAGAGGDPHFKLFNGVSCDFHGHCDLLLIDSPAAADGAGLSIQVRSSPLREMFSCISAAAIQIGDRVLTIGSGGHHAIDGVPQTTGQTDALVVDDFHQCPVQSSVSKKGRHVHKIHLGNGPQGKEEIDIRECKNWITITLLHPSASNVDKSKGLLGRFPDGAMVGRDGKTIHSSYDDFGQDWQVHPGESLLGPYPGPISASCKPLQAKVDRRRRLGETSIARSQAKEVCQHWGNQMEDCINDVLISGDLEMANTGPV